MDYTDVVVDGRFILAQRDVTLEWKGSPNQRVIDVKKDESTRRSRTVRRKVVTQKEKETLYGNH